MKKPTIKAKAKKKDPLSVKDLPATGRTTAKVKGGLMLTGLVSAGCVGGSSLNFQGSALTIGCTGGLTRPS